MSKASDGGCRLQLRMPVTRQFGQLRVETRPCGYFLWGAVRYAEQPSPGRLRSHVRAGGGRGARSTGGCSDHVLVDPDAEGMLGSSRWGGFFLPTDLDHVYMLFEFRRVQEMAASRLAASHATPAELRTIEEAAETCRQGHVTGEAALFDRGDDEFHLAVAAASHNQFLVAAVREARRLQRQSNIIGMHGAVGGHAPEAIEEHAAILKAIRGGDPDIAAQATATHLDNTLEDYRHEIQRRLFG